ncbi:uncharacterized protein [Antedon mediterranea]|uniref:uncharacterized protein n=1 Tax=Antedon mediterranea TaxID=105859 RepID=UPI003AF6E84D
MHFSEEFGCSTEARLPEEVSVKNDLQSTRLSHPLYSKMKLFILPLKVIGVYHEPPFEDRSNFEATFGKFYHIFISLISIFNFVRFVPELWKDNVHPGLTYSEIIMCAFNLYCMVGIVLAYSGCSRKKHGLLSFFEHNQKYCNSVASRKLNCVPGNAHIKREVYLALLFSMFHFSICTATQYINAYVFETSEYHISSAPWTSSISVALFVIIVNHHVFLFLHYAVFVSLISRYLQKQFKLLGERFSKMIETECPAQQSGEAVIDEQLYESIRKQHNHLCDSVSHADACFSVYLLVMCLIQIPIIIFLAYQALFSPEGVRTKMTYLSWLTSNSICMGVVTIHAALLNTEIHDFSDKIHRLSALASKTCNDNLISTHMLFLSRLNGPPIGYSVFGFVTITKEVLLTGVGFIFTYFVLLVQFQ